MADEKQAVVLRTYATLNRPGYGDKKAEQLRIELCSFNGSRPYVACRVWWQPEEGTWAPGKKGITFRASELDAVCAALMDAGSIKTAQMQIPVAKPEEKADEFSF